ncbi:hypothetical protein O9929_12945 [Vibrio lentus]|nr:hypothetical protein [Vibrio lentus]
MDKAAPGRSRTRVRYWCHGRISDLVGWDAMNIGKRCAISLPSDERVSFTTSPLTTPKQHKVEAFNNAHGSM